MFRKTTSQQIARVFEIVGYLLLIPVALSLIYPAIGLIASVFALHFGLFLLCLIPFLLTGLGTLLLVGYFKHSRGTLDEDKVWLLWFGTFIFNGLPLIPALIWFCRASYLAHRSGQGGATEYFFPGLCITWLATAVFLSGFAFYKEMKN